MLDAAENLIRSRGADGWSLEDLAGESGVSGDDIHSEFDLEWEVFSLTITRDEKRWETAITIGTLIDAMALQATLGDTTVRPNYMFDACVTVTGRFWASS